MESKFQMPGVFWLPSIGNTVQLQVCHRWPSLAVGVQWIVGGLIGTTDLLSIEHTLVHRMYVFIGMIIYILCFI